MAFLQREEQTTRSSNGLCWFFCGSSKLPNMFIFVLAVSFLRQYFPGALDSYVNLDKQVTTSSAASPDVSVSYLETMQLFRRKTPLVDEEAYGQLNLVSDLPQTIQREYMKDNMERFGDMFNHLAISPTQVPSQAKPYMQFFGFTVGWSKTWSVELVDTLVKAVKNGEDISCGDYPDSAGQITRALSRLTRLLGTKSQT